MAVEPKDSPVLSEGRSGSHKIQGIGAGFVPEVLDTAVCGDIMKIYLKIEDGIVSDVKFETFGCGSCEGCHG